MGLGLGLALGLALVVARFGIGCRLGNGFGFGVGVGFARVSQILCGVPKSFRDCVRFHKNILKRRLFTRGCIWITPGIMVERENIRKRAV